jgi:hypothetical protein
MCREENVKPSSSQQHTNRVSGWSTLGKLSPAPRRKLVHLRRQAGRYACLVRNRPAAQHQGIPHAGGAPCCGFLELRKCCGREHANEQASHCNHSASNSDHYDLPRDGYALGVIGPVLPLESCDGHHKIAIFAGALRGRTGIFVTTVTAELVRAAKDGNTTKWSTSIKGGRHASCCL